MSRVLHPGLFRDIVSSRIYQEKFLGLQVAGKLKQAPSPRYFQASHLHCLVITRCHDVSHVSTKLWVPGGDIGHFQRPSKWPRRSELMWGLKLELDQSLLECHLRRRFCCFFCHSLLRKLTARGSVASCVYSSILGTLCVYASSRHEVSKKCEYTDR